ncbi:MAG TPA: lysozyme inhibitor LprI family protein [Xanthobacteraceae bacterium]|nr:lysozyme inhibitor LprI family protein [Xanthobacteraceae bacterium]
MRRARAGLVIAFCAAVLPARAETACQAYGDEYQTCGDRNTHDIVMCVGKLYEGWQKRVEAAYQKLLGMEKEADRLKFLKLSQEAWLKYRDVNCDWYEAGEGTIHRIWGSECMRSMTACRALELEDAGETH